MANYSTLKSNVASVVRTNGQNAITGANLQSTLYGMIESLGADYQLMGIATASTNPGSNIDQNIAYLATSGSSTVTFTHFLSSAQTPLSLAPNKFGVLRYNGTWSIQSADLPSGGGGSTPIFIYNPNIANSRTQSYSAANARKAAYDSGYIDGDNANGLILVYLSSSLSSWTAEMYIGGGATYGSDSSWAKIYPVGGGGEESSPYIYNPNIENNTNLSYSGAEARTAAINSGYTLNGVILVYKKGNGTYAGTWTVEVYVGGGSSTTSDSSWEQIYPIDTALLTSSIVRGMVNIITYSSKITFTKSGSTWTVRIPSGTSVVIDGVEYGGYNSVQSWSATCTPDLEDIGVVIYNVDTSVLSFEESSNVNLGPRDAVLFTFCFSNSKCTLKDSDFSVTIP